MPNCTIIKTGATITSTPSERVAELKSLIDAVEIPAIPRVAGDVVLYDNVKDGLVFADANADFATDYPASRFTPIGVVAIPNSHNVYGDNKNGVVSLKFMNYTTPDEGSTSSQTMYWGDSTVLLGDTLPYFPAVGTIGEPTSEITSMAETGYYPSDNCSGVVCPTDPKAFYTTLAATNTAAPSPYLADGSRNPVYYQTTDPSSEENCLACFDGRGRTQLMLDAVTVSGWQTATSITNAYTTGNYPSACCCWRYHTAGTSQGDWYLPSEGELGYFVARIKTINTTIANLVDVYGSGIGGVMDGDIYFWGSDQHSASHARCAGIMYGNLTSSLNTNYPSSVRAFARL